MALRNQIPEEKATYPDPVYGVNLRASEDDLQPGESRKMQNVVYDGGTRSRTGSRRLTTSSLGAFRIRGGHRYYYGGNAPQSTRLVAYSNRISSISGTGTETILNNTMTSDKDTFFTTWSMTDKVYIGNASDTLRAYDGNSATFEQLDVDPTAVNIPIARTGVFPILDRLMAITTNGIERTDPRNPLIWSNDSSWATLRPSRVGLFTHAVPFTIRGTDTLYPGLIAFQANAHYVITGNDFGSDVQLTSPPTGEDASIQLLDPQVGTSSPYGVCTVPGVGLFWFTSDLNVYWLPDGALNGSYIGDKIQSVTGDIYGINACNPAALSQVWMTYFYPFVMLSIPTGSNTYASVQWWLDIRRFPKDVVWYGPMVGQTVGRAWAELQNGDNAIFGGEGNSASGAYVYQLRVPKIFTDATGSTDTALTRKYQTHFPNYNWPSRQKYVHNVNFDLYMPTGSASMNLYDLDSTIATGIAINEV